MRVFGYNSNKEFLLNIRKYAINWEKSGASNLERQFRDLIYPYWKRSIILYQCPLPCSKYRLDFLNCNKRLVVEIDGPQHEKYVKFFHGSLNGWKESMKRDTVKYEWMEKNNIKFIQLRKEDLDDFSPDKIYEKFGINII